MGNVWHSVLVAWLVNETENENISPSADVDFDRSPYHFFPEILPILWKNSNKLLEWPFNHI